MREAEKIFALPLAQRHSLPEHLLLPALDYVLDERVESAIRIGDRAAALVRGFTDLYRVSTSLEPPWEGTCTCGRSAPCRHQAAVVLALDRIGDRVLSLPPTRPVAPIVWAETLFRTLASDPDALAPLRETTGAHLPADVLTEAAVPGRTGPQDDESARGLYGIATEIRDRARPGDADRMADLARRLREWIVGGPVGPAETPAVVTLLGAFLDGLDAPLEAAVRALFLSLGADGGPQDNRAAMDVRAGGPGRARIHMDEGPLAASAAPVTEDPLTRGIAFLEIALWGTALPGTPEDRRPAASRSDRAHRAADLLLERTREHPSAPTAATLAFLEAHAVLPALSPWRAAWLLEHGQVSDGERLAMAAYLHADGLRYRALRDLLLDRVGQGSEPPRHLLLAEWEAVPVAPSGADPHGRDPDDALAEILARVPPAIVPAIRRHAQEVLTRHRAYASLCRLARDAGDLREAIRWALADGPRAASPQLCLDLVPSALASGADAQGREAMTALELMSAAFRREADGQGRQAIVQRARSLSHGEASLRTSWAQIRRRYFPESDRRGPGLPR